MKSLIKIYEQLTKDKTSYYKNANIWEQKIKSLFKPCKSYRDWREESEHPEIAFCITDKKNNTIGYDIQNWTNNYITETKDGSALMGVAHFWQGQRTAKDFVDKTILPKILEKMDSNSDKKFVFLGEGGIPETNYKGAYNDNEQAHIFMAMERYGEQNNIEVYGSTWEDMDGLDVENPLTNKKAYIKLSKITGFGLDKLLATMWCQDAGQDYFCEEIKKAMTKGSMQFLKDMGVYKPFDESQENKKIMYDLIYPEDTGLKNNIMSYIGEAYNRLRDLSLLKRTRQYEEFGYVCVICAGASHVYSLKNCFNKI